MEAHSKCDSSTRQTEEFKNLELVKTKTINTYITLLGFYSIKGTFKNFVISRLKISQAQAKRIRNCQEL